MNRKVCNRLQINGCAEEKSLFLHTTVPLWPLIDFSHNAELCFFVEHVNKHLKFSFNIFPPSKLPVVITNGYFYAHPLPYRHFRTLFINHERNNRIQQDISCPSVFHFGLLFNSLLSLSEFVHRCQPTKHWKYSVESIFYWKLKKRTSSTNFFSWATIFTELKSYLIRKINNVISHLKGNLNITLSFQELMRNHKILKSNKMLLWHLTWTNT